MPRRRRDREGDQRKCRRTERHLLPQTPSSASEGEADVEAGLEQEVGVPPPVLRREGVGDVGRDWPVVERDRRLEEQAVQQPEVVPDAGREGQLRTVADLLVLCVVVPAEEGDRADRGLEALRQQALVGETAAELTQLARIG